MSRLTLRAEGVTKTYGTGAVAMQALRGVDFQASEGEFVLLTGPSGSGKTTLLSALGCVLKPTSGRVMLFDEEVSAMRESDLPRLRLAYIGFIFQGHNLVASLDATQNVALPMRLRGWSTEDANREARRLLEEVARCDYDAIVVELVRYFADVRVCCKHCSNNPRKFKTTAGLIRHVVVIHKITGP